MEKRFFLAFFLTILLMIVYFQTVGKYVSTEQKTQQTATQEVIEEKAPVSTEFLPSSGASSTNKTVSFGKFDITYSTTGGYIQKIYSKDFGQELVCKNIGLIAGKHKLSLATK